MTSTSDALVSSVMSRRMLQTCNRLTIPFLVGTNGRIVRGLQAGLVVTDRQLPERSIFEKFPASLLCGRLWVVFILYLWWYWP